MLISTLPPPRRAAMTTRGAGAIIEVGPDGASRVRTVHHPPAGAASVPMVETQVAGAAAHGAGRSRPSGSTGVATAGWRGIVDAPDWAVRQRGRAARIFHTCASTSPEWSECWARDDRLGGRGSVRQAGGSDHRGRSEGWEMDLSWANGHVREPRGAVGAVDAPATRGLLRAVHDRSFDLTLIGSGRSVTARLFLDDDGEMDGVLPTGVERRRLDRRIGMTPATSGTAACRPARTDMCRQLTGRMNSS